MVAVLVIANSGQAQDLWNRGYLYRFETAGNSLDRFLGDERVGDIRAGSFRIDISDTNRVHCLSLEYENFDNRVPLESGLELSEEKFSIGLDHSVGQGCHLVLAGNMFSYNLSDPYWAFGVYPNREWSSRIKTLGDMDVRKHKIAVGLERDNETSSLAYGYLRWYPTQLGIFLGASNEKFISEGHAKHTYQYDRVGIAAIMISGDLRNHYFVGSAYNCETERAAWMTGYARIAKLRDRGINPAMLIALRQKPESFYTLGIATLWGRTINDYVAPGIFESFYRGSLNQSRVVRNRDFNTVGVGNAYDAQDFGRVSLTGTYMDIEAAETNMVAFEYALYGTWPGSFGSLTRPYLGLAYSGETDLIFDYRSFRMIDPDREWYTLYLGGKLLLSPRVDPYRRCQYGYLRLQAGLRFKESVEGVFLETTVWY